MGAQPLCEVPQGSPLQGRQSLAVVRTENMVHSWNGVFKGQIRSHVQCCLGPARDGYAVDGCDRLQQLTLSPPKVSAAASVCIGWCKEHDFR
ncbi:hypothetical protein AO716_08215 [Arthrobacter sp. Edens01]|nr:hypothetical protein AO716_08215 [Arthrobacter sp. Edens01]